MTLGCSLRPRCRGGCQTRRRSAPASSAACSAGDSLFRAGLPKVFHADGLSASVRSIGSVNRQLEHHAVSHWLFRVPIRGSLIDLYDAGALFVLAALALGLTVSTLARAQFQAIQLTALTFLASMLLSGFMFPFEGMPPMAQWLGQAIPLTPFVRMSRGILLRGADFGALGTGVLALCIFFAVFMSIVTARFMKRLD